MSRLTRETVFSLHNLTSSPSHLPGLPSLPGHGKDILLDDLYKQAMKMSTSKPFYPSSNKPRVRRDGGYGGGCKKSGLGIFNFLLFLVVLLGLLNSLLSSAMTMIMINGENVSLLQVLDFS